MSSIKIFKIKSFKTKSHSQDHKEEYHSLINKNLKIIKTKF